VTTTETPIGPDDIVHLNRRTVERTGATARLAGTALVVVGAVGVAAWLWLTVRQQMTLDDDGGGPFRTGRFGETSLTDRLDTAVTTIGLLLSGAIAVVAGLAVRLLADYTIARTGGSLTGFSVGDPVPTGGLVGDQPEPIELPDLTDGAD
jgi:hypothetical protein